MQVSGRFSILLLLSFCLVPLSSADAQDITVGGSTGSSFGTVIVPTQPAPLRVAPPGSLGPPGKKMGTTSKDKNYLILGGKQIPKFFSSDRWVKIAPIMPDGTVRPEDGGWVYWGEDPKSSSPNFLTKNPDDIDPEVILNIKKYLRAVRPIGKIVI